MNNKQQLQELVRHIVRQALKELMYSGDLQQQQQADMMDDPSRPPVDAMTPIEKAKQDREQEKRRRDALKASEEELKTAKKESDFQKQKLDQSKRFNIPTLQKKIQGLKGGIGGI